MLRSWSSPRSRRYPILAVGLLLALPSLAQENMTVESISRTMALTDKEKQDLHAGKFVHREAEETSKKELAGRLAILLPAPLAEVKELSQNFTLFNLSPAVIAMKVLVDDQPTQVQFLDAVFTSQESGEIRKLADAGPGSEFNLSQDEIDSLQSLRAQHAGRCDQDAACQKAFSDAYSRLLYDRMKSYRAGGIATIAAYQRGEQEIANPAEELQKTGDALTLIKEHLPALYKSFMEHPESQIEGVEHFFLWKKQKIQDRPTFSLAHRMRFESDESLIVLDREFYVGQSYNSLVSVAGAFAVDDQTVVVYLNRTSTDQVAGFGSGTKHAIGRKMMIGEIKKNLTQLRDKIAAGS
jgi:hypothetical protein